ncbi:MAG: hypothetical protein HZA93_07070 [Verrucomicrobia bacterium]|nr:hypothetical protein [Verrucomicrobiota bacterium]
MKSPALLRLVWWLGGLALVLGLARDPLLNLLPKPRELPRLDGATGQAWAGGGFVLGLGFNSLANGLLPAHVQTASSGIFGDDWTGRTETSWFKTKPATVHVAVAGYPQHAGCHLWAEFRNAAGTLTRVDCPIADPREEWNVWEIRRPPDAIAVRIVGEDRATDNCGWVGFSHPYRAWPGWVTAAYQFAHLLTTVALVLTLVWGPGLLWRPATTAPELQTVILLGAGPLLLALAGVVIWSAGGIVPPRSLGFVLIAALWLTLGIAAHRQRFDFGASPALLRVLAVSALVVVAVVAKSSYSVGPEGELYRGTVSRNLSIGDRLDSRFSFYTVQAAAHHFAPAAPETEKYFRPWTFFSRGPLPGLAAIPVVLATGGHPPVALPEKRWSPFDRTGFAAYRVTMIVLASAIVVAVFTLLRAFAGDRWAVTGAGLLALTPFGVHEVMFTWPKWAATAWLVVSFSLLHARRPGAAGLALGVGFLFHPLVLLWCPWLAVWSAGRSERNATAVATTLLRLGAGAALLVLPWMVIGRLAPHTADAVFAGQGDFLRYWTLADRETATWPTWWHSRWMNFANTFVPLHGYLSEFSFNHFRAQSPYGGTVPIVKFAALWWTSLPLGLGLGLWALSFTALWRALKLLPAATWLFVAAPALLITAYWGMDPLGFMRECGHPLFVAIIVLLCLVAAQTGGWLDRVLSHRVTPWLQLPETWLMLWLTALANHHPWSVEFAHLDPLYVVLNALALALAAWVLSQARPADAGA